MKAVDTNVLVRILITDDKQADQIKLARQFAKKAKQLFIPQIVQVELVWVLESAYDINKQEILKILHHLQTNEAFELEEEQAFGEALQLYQTHNVDFSDSLILTMSNHNNCVVVTFDKKFSRLPKVIYLE